jgi:hypothetical protein
MGSVDPKAEPAMRRETTNPRVRRLQDGSLESTLGGLGIGIGCGGDPVIPNCLQLDGLQSDEKGTPAGISDGDGRRLTERLAGHRCPLCGSAGSILGTRDGCRLRTCCGTLLSWAWEDAGAYERQYEGLAYHHDASLALGLAPHTERFAEHLRAANCRLEWLVAQEFSLGQRLLDVGSSNGAMVCAARRRGHVAEGYEPSGPMCAWSAANGTPLRHGDWRALRGMGHLVTATDVIEHLLEPAGFLRRARRHAPYLYLETPDWREDRGCDWKHIKVREHPCLYSEAALLALAGRCGWQPVEIYRPIEGKLGALFRSGIEEYWNGR